MRYRILFIALGNRSPVVAHPHGSMGWEHRWFAPSESALTELGPRQDLRTDIYFPASDDVGVKLRDGRGDLEVKACLGRAEGAVERWKKWHLASDERLITGGRVQDSALLASQIVVATKKPALAQAWDRWPDACVPPLSVHVVKHRTQTLLDGLVLEEAALVLRAVRHSGGLLVLEEGWRSVAVEGGSAEAIAAAVAQHAEACQPPEDALVGGYPQMVCAFARRALDAGRNPS